MPSRHELEVGRHQRPSRHPAAEVRTRRRGSRRGSDDPAIDRRSRRTPSHSESGSSPMHPHSRSRDYSHTAADIPRADESGRRSSHATHRRSGGKSSTTGDLDGRRSSYHQTSRRATKVSPRSTPSPSETEGRSHRPHRQSMTLHEVPRTAEQLPPLAPAYGGGHESRHSATTSHRVITASTTAAAAAHPQRRHTQEPTHMADCRPPSGLDSARPTSALHHRPPMAELRSPHQPTHSVATVAAHQLPREVTQWLHTLQLPVRIKNPKRDCANGYLIAHILAVYWRHVDLHGFENNISRREKESNWNLIKRAFKRREVWLSPTMVDGMMASRDGYAVAFLQQLYEIFTGNKLAAPGSNALLRSDSTAPETMAPTDQTGSSRRRPTPLRSPLAQHASAARGDGRIIVHSELQHFLELPEVSPAALQRSSTTKSATGITRSTGEAAVRRKSAQDSGRRHRHRRGDHHHRGTPSAGRRDGGRREGSQRENVARLSGTHPPNLREATSSASSGASSHRNSSRASSSSSGSTSHGRSRGGPLEMMDSILRSVIRQEMFVDGDFYGENGDSEEDELRSSTRSTDDDRSDVSEDVPKANRAERAAAGSHSARGSEWLEPPSFTAGGHTGLHWLVALEDQVERERPAPVASVVQRVVADSDGKNAAIANDDAESPAPWQAVWQLVTRMWQSLTSSADVVARAVYRRPATFKAVVAALIPDQLLAHTLEVERYVLMDRGYGAHGQKFSESLSAYGDHWRLEVRVTFVSAVLSVLHGLSEWSATAVIREDVLPALQPLLYALPSTRLARLLAPLITITVPDAAPRAPAQNLLVCPLTDSDLKPHGDSVASGVQEPRRRWSMSATGAASTLSMFSSGREPCDWMSPKSNVGMSHVTVKSLPRVLQEVIELVDKVLFHGSVAVKSPRLKARARLNLRGWAADDVDAINVPYVLLLEAVLRDVLARTATVVGATDDFPNPQESSEQSGAVNAVGAPQASGIYVRSDAPAQSVSSAILSMNSSMQAASCVMCFQYAAPLLRHERRLAQRVGLRVAHVLLTAGCPPRAFFYTVFPLLFALEAAARQDGGVTPQTLSKTIRGRATAFCAAVAERADAECVLRRLESHLSRTPFEAEPSSSSRDPGTQEANAAAVVLKVRLLRLSISSLVASLVAAMAPPFTAFPAGPTKRRVSSSLTMHILTPGFDLHSETPDPAGDTANSACQGRPSVSTRASAGSGGVDVAAAGHCTQRDEVPGQHAPATPHGTPAKPTMLQLLSSVLSDLVAALLAYMAHPCDSGDGAGSVAGTAWWLLACELAEAMPTLERLYTCIECRMCCAVVLQSTPGTWAHTQATQDGECDVCGACLRSASESDEGMAAQRGPAYFTLHHPLSVLGDAAGVSVPIGSSEVTADHPRWRSQLASETALLATVLLQFFRRSSSSLSATATNDGWRSLRLRERRAEAAHTSTEADRAAYFPSVDVAIVSGRFPSTAFARVPRPGVPVVDSWLYDAGLASVRLLSAALVAHWCTAPAEGDPQGSASSRPPYNRDRDDESAVIAFLYSLVLSQRAVEAEAAAEPAYDAVNRMDPFISSRLELNANGSHDRVPFISWGGDALLPNSMSPATSPTSELADGNNVAKVRAAWLRIIRACAEPFRAVWSAAETDPVKSRPPICDTAAGGAGGCSDISTLAKKAHLVAVFWYCHLRTALAVIDGRATGIGGGKEKEVALHGTLQSMGLPPVEVDEEVPESFAVATAAAAPTDEALRCQSHWLTMSIEELLRVYAADATRWLLAIYNGAATM